MANSEWIESPEVIALLIKGGGLMVGDKIRVKNARNILLEHAVRDGEVVVVEALCSAGHTHPWLDDPDGEEPHLLPEVPVVFSSSGFVYALENIAAWRRPLTRKEE